MKIIKPALLVTLAISVFLSTWHLFVDDIMFHSDIARDFLLLQEIVDTGKLPLIGARTGGIGGLFHGPAWIYLNLPAFIIGKGNPVFVGWFWLLLFVISIYSVYTVGKKLGKPVVGLIAACIYASAMIVSVRNFLNPTGALLLSPLFFFYSYKFAKDPKLIYVIINSFLAGIMIQFQIAFGAPLFLLFSLLVAQKAFYKKRFKHLLGLFAIVISLSTYMVFEFRHSFLQTKAVLAFITAGGEGNLQNILINRLGNFLFYSISPFSDTTLAVWGGLLAFVAIFKGIDKQNKQRGLILHFLFYYVGYWLITLLYPGNVAGYYFWPFLPLVAIVLATAIKSFNNKWSAVFFITIVTLNLINGLQNTILHNDFFGKHNASWLSVKATAETIFKESDSEFGYFVFTPDQFGYAPKYAIDYVGKNFNSEYFLNIKKPITYLIYAPAPDDKPYLNGEGWKKGMVKIEREANDTHAIPGGFVIEKYLLSDEELKINPDPNLITDLHFR